MTVTLAPGQSVNLTIVVDPGGTAYTAKVGLSFTPGLVSVSNFSPASGWLPVTQPGYDSVDNAQGSFVKTGGVAGGFSAPKVFGTVTLTATGEGSATVTVNGATQVLNSSNQNTFSGGNSAMLLIRAPAPTLSPPPPASSPNPRRNVFTTPVPTPKATSSATTTPPLATSTATSSQVAAVESATPSLNTTILIGGMAATFALGFLLGKQRL